MSNPWERGEPYVAWQTTVDPRTNGRAGRIGEVVIYRDPVGGEEVRLRLVGPSCHDWTEETAGAGPPGDDGLSAYEVAVANGFVGSEAAWLASLVGPAGVDGADGADGAQGPPGNDGATGPAGPAPAGTGFVRVTGGVLDTTLSAVGTTHLGGDITTAGKALLDDADAAAQRTTLGLGTAATQASSAFEAAGAVAAHAAAGDPHPAYALESTLATVATSGSASDLGAGTLPATRIADGSIALAKHANMATARLVGRTTAGSGVPEELTGTQVTALLDTVTTSAKGLAPTAPNDTTKFLRGDGTWAVPAGTGSVTDRIQLTVAAGTYTNQGAGPTELSVANRTIVDLTNFANCRLLARVSTTGSTASIKAQYSTDGTNFSDLTTTISLSGTGLKAGASQAIPAGAKALVVLRLVATGGNGTEDPAVEAGVVVEVS